jgi:hypothetical protein
MVLLVPTRATTIRAHAIICVAAVVDIGRRRGRNETPCSSGAGMIQRYAIDGPVLLVPARIAALLERHYKMHELRLSARGWDTQLDAVLAAWHAIALQWIDDSTRNASATGSEVAADAEPVGALMLSTATVAALASCTPRAVRLAAAEGRLVGCKSAGRWVFDRVDVKAWTSSRKP